MCVNHVNQSLFTLCKVLFMDYYELLMLFAYHVYIGILTTMFILSLKLDD